MGNYNKECVDAIYKDREFIIIGLTGRTGSGCSTAREILEKTKLEEIYKTDVNLLNGNEKRKALVVYNYLIKNWKAFDAIKVSNVIVLMVIEAIYKTPTESFNEAVKKLGNKLSIDSLLLSKLLATQSVPNPEYRIPEASDKGIFITRKFFTYKKLSQYFNQYMVADALNKKLLIKLGRPAYKKLFQCFGDNIRRTGNPLDLSDTTNGEACFSLAKKIWEVIKSKKEKLTGTKKKPFFVIDAIRNPYDAQYFKQRFSAFYMVAITVDHATRRKRLLELNHTKEEIQHIDYKEGIEAEELDASPSELEQLRKNIPDPKMLFGQNIGACLEFADIFIDNPNDEMAKNGNPRKLADELIKFYALMRRPGLVTPTPIERSMQIAFTAKYNSGCLSRQVGAVVTNSSFSVLSIGWNDVFKGQVSCNLRNVEYFLRQHDEEAFSPFERTTKNFFEHIQKKFEGNSSKSSKLRETGKIPVYCFKSEYNELKNTNNQVFVRALHAEENAFLQIALRGGVGIEGGFLFTTASPCELCAKKAYQLGIKKIYYVDPYPGISKELILLTGEHRPEMVLFSGAIGRAYDQLYRPLMPVKDEVKYLMDPS